MRVLEVVQKDVPPLREALTALQREHDTVQEINRVFFSPFYIGLRNTNAAYCYPQLLLSYTHPHIYIYIYIYICVSGRRGRGRALLGVVVVVVVVVGGGGKNV